MEVIKDLEGIRQELDMINAVKTCKKLLSLVSDKAIEKREKTLLNELLPQPKQ